ncbi:hypothetical protein L484_027095 [Morus notabilis]|uniref:Uncharacterized protein n=1 Tax=Morus notabilis TaxID=981085 RepID=W9S8Z4_9ROSA|nr:hypothetical protein L484_027095 [Morus notabilis]
MAIAPHVAVPFTSPLRIFLRCNASTSIGQSRRALHSAKMAYSRSCGAVALYFLLFLFTRASWLWAGVVAHDEVGAVLGALLRNIDGRFSPSVGECLAVRERARFALVRGDEVWSAETDARMCTNAVQSMDLRAPEANVIENIRDVISYASSCNVC